MTREDIGNVDVLVVGAGPTGLTLGNQLARFGIIMHSLRRIIVRGVIAPALSRPLIRAAAFHFVSQLGIHYRKSPAMREGEPRMRHGPKAGDQWFKPRLR
jgi:ribulose 1,5-bisphosphate synthetase/thiazole synthase